MGDSIGAVLGMLVGVVGALVFVGLLLLAGLLPA
jgi:hypothetical protein